MEVDSGDPHQPHDIKIAVVGNVDSGKSSLVGVLTRSVLDDGRGGARSHVFRHQHEKDSGRSSSVTSEIMGFDGATGKPVSVDLKASRQRIWQHCHSTAERTVTFVDLCGHDKYLKTTIFGLTALLPCYTMCVIGANMGVSKMTKEHVGICVALGLPLLIVVTKVDLCPPDIYKHTCDSIVRVLKQARKLPYHCRSEADVHTAAAAILTDRLTPIISVSNVTGEGVDLLRQLLWELPIRVSTLSRKVDVSAFTRGAVAGHEDVGAGDGAPASPPLAGAPPAAFVGDAPGAAGTPPREARGYEAQEAPTAGGAGSGGSTAWDGSALAATHLSSPGEALVDSIFNVPGVGTVVAGTVVFGAIRTGDTMLLGPDRMGEFIPVTVRSIHVQYCAVSVATPGGSAAFAIRPKKPAHSEKKRQWVRKGMSLVHPSLNPVSVWEFTAEILVLHHQTTLAVGYAPIMHCGVVSQCAQITCIAGTDGRPMSSLRTGDRAVVSCRFQYRPEYIHPGDLLLFREGRAKGVGRIRSTSSGVPPGPRGTAAAGAAAASGAYPACPSVPVP